MTDSLPAPPELDPAALAASEFARTRRGLKPTEVRAALGRAADALRTWSERDARLTEQIAELEQQLVESQELDEGRIASVLGEETARIVTAAREAAAEIRSKAEDQAARLIAETEQQATAAAEALRSEAQALRDDAARVHDEAVAAATELRTSAGEQAERVRTEAAEEAATTREEAAALATSTVSDAQARADELLGAAELVLSERTAEAESAAAEILDAATARAEQADRAADDVRAGADEYAASVRAGADQDARDRVAEAEAESEALIAAATERGRAMVAEARAVRERMLTDLAEKRRTARRQIEGALAGRDRIVEVLRAAGGEVATTIAELEAADDAAATAADAAAAVVDGELDVELEELRATLAEDEQAEAALGAAGRVVEPDGGAATGDVEAAGDVTTEQSVGDTAGGGDGDVGDGSGAERPEAPAARTAVVELEVVPTDAAALVDLDLHIAHDDGEHDEPTAAQDAAEELASPPEPHDDVDADAEGATVHDLFARIRAEGLDEAGDTDVGGAVAEAAAVDAAVVEAGVVEAGVVEAAPDEIDLTDGASPAAVGESLFDRRDELLNPVEKSLARVLKRLAGDEQNEILDRLRRVKRGRPDPAEILPDGDPGPFVEALEPEFVRAVEAGTAFWAELGHAAADGPADDETVRAELESRVTAFLTLHRAHLERTFAEADEAALDVGEIGDRVRATYRDWRSGSLADLAGDLATAGFAMGERSAAGDGTPWRWVVDHGGLPCADGEDNALAGEVACGEPFPTGDVTPPAHPGCRCILAPAAR